MAAKNLFKRVKNLTTKRSLSIEDIEKSLNLNGGSLKNIEKNKIENEGELLESISILLNLNLLEKAYLYGINSQLLFRDDFIAAIKTTSQSSLERNEEIWSRVLLG